MLSDIELLCSCIDFSLPHIHKAEQKVFKELKTSGATRLVAALRIFRLQRALLAIGMFSLFESLLQDIMSWQEPFKEVGPFLKSRGEDTLEERFTNYKDAINVLKHGKGRSYEKLLGKVGTLDFNVKNIDEYFFNEGDVSEVNVLIDVDDHFLKRSAKIIEDVNAIVVSHNLNE